MHRGGRQASSRSIHMHSRCVCCRVCTSAAAAQHTPGTWISEKLQSGNVAAAGVLLPGLVHEHATPRGGCQASRPGGPPPEKASHLSSSSSWHRAAPRQLPGSANSEAARFRGAPPVCSSLPCRSAERLLAPFCAMEVHKRGCGLQGRCPVRAPAMPGPAERLRRLIALLCLPFDRQGVPIVVRVLTLGTHRPPEVAAGGPLAASPAHI